MINLLETLPDIPAVELEWMALSPLLVLLGVGCLAIVLEAVVPRSYRYLAQTALSVLAIVAALTLTVTNWATMPPSIVAEGLVAVDGPTNVFWSLLLVVGLGAVALFAERGFDGRSAFASAASTVPGSPLEREADRLRREHTEIFPLLLFSLFGMMLFASANNLLVLFVAVEIFSLPLYLLTGMARRRRLLSQEAALKYFLLGSLASAIMLYGIALLYGYSGGLQLADIDAAITAGTASQGLLLAGLLLTSVGLLFKIGAVPFHAWTPDVYMGAPTPVTAFMAVATKTAAVAGLLRVFYVGLGGAQWDWQLLFSVVAVATMVLGSTVALAQTDMKRLLAYSSIAHAGFILVGVVGAVGGGEGVAVSSVSSIAFYLLTYGLATLGAFAIVTMVRRSGGEANALDAWKGLGKRNPLLAVLMTLFMLSFAGIPPTAGFIGKLTVFSAAWVGGYGWLVLVALLTSAVAAFFYLKVVVAMWFQDADEDTVGDVESPSLWTWVVLLVTAVATLVLGLVPGSLLSLFADAAQFIR
ncbi:NADH-quinone oxidoreductase subunit N [Tessaracoccus bendigoensis DSM 12906]|uniref:NADH-quinone oxidoreductase subunit N n=1 Tax=Tessaracoccus bendigoensis DSM 12906 TaxID=1123357 RepID=A0A1M6DUT2_9ACTN|nr:NADH-quinone oxidoreductase subunit NuoN [Tessaracoccus bendigoensis]SHI76890.1 NADH-quinone oxidoreductase subunit N [Tessaracoccus bendigoensis DSM 12906]